jgi:gliding motility-associated-like protein
LYDTIDVSRLDFGDGTVESPAITTVHRYATDDTFTVQLRVQNINGCADSVTQIVAVWPSPVADFSFEGICMPDSVTFVDTSSVSAYPIINRYWDFGDGKVDTGSVLVKHPYPNSGPYNVTLIVASSLGCTDTTSKLLDSLVDIPVTSWALVGGSMPICKSDSVIFEAQGGDSVVWNIDGDTNAQKAFRTSGTYYFTAINKGKCSAQDSVQVFAYTPTDIKPNPDTVIYRGRQVNLYVKNAAFNIKWTPSEFILGDSNKAVAKTTQLIDSTRFYVSALDSNGCPDLDSVTIRIIDPPLVKIPNIITPNGDDENETWNLIDIPDLFLYSIVISDRQGKRVYDSENYKNDWAATDFNGSELPNGVYFYYMKNRQTNQLYRGYIQVIR